MFSQVLPVYNQQRIFPFMESRVGNPHGIYNCGIGISADKKTRVGVVRSCTVNSRHRLGWKPMRSPKYSNELHLVRFDDNWEPIDSRLIDTGDRIIHDVRIDKIFFVDEILHVSGTGCEKKNGFFEPVSFALNKGPGTHVLKPTITPLCLPESLSKTNQKNYIYHNHTYDMGYVDQLKARGRLHMNGSITTDAVSLKLRGGTPYVKFDDKHLLACMHLVDELGDGVRSYHAVFVLLDNLTYNVVRRSHPVKFTSNCMANMIQFPMGLVWDLGQRLIISYGLNDADNIIGEIKPRDILNLMV